MRQLFSPHLPNLPQPMDRKHAGAASAAIAVLAVTIALVWAFWTTFGELAARWSGDAQYSHGYIVPVFAAYLLYARRSMLTSAAIQPIWRGLPLLVLGILLRLAGGYFYVPWVEQVSLLVVLAGIALTLGGSAVLRWSWPAIAFLIFMIPFPGRVEGALAYPLQRLGTWASTFTLQLLGYPALAEGNLILLSEAELNIVEACSGLRMLIVFFALSTACAIVIQKPLIYRVLVVVSAIPIALFANVVRITITGILYETVDNETANHFFHEVAGWLMMLIGVALLWLEVQVLSRLFVVSEPEMSPTGAATSAGTAERGPKWQGGTSAALRGEPLGDVAARG